jgi:hypothetical protein
VAARILEQGLGGKDGRDLANRPLLDEPSAHTFALCHVLCQTIPAGRLSRSECGTRRPHLR